MTLEPVPLLVGTPIWSNGFGCVTWVGEHQVGVALLSNGEPSVRGFVPVSAACAWANRWLEVRAEDGRVESVVE